MNLKHGLPESVAGGPHPDAPKPQDTNVAHVCSRAGLRSKAILITQVNNISVRGLSADAMERLADGSGHDRRLRDGSFVSFTEQGDPTGASVFWYSGLRSSRVFSPPGEPAAQGLRARIIVVATPSKGS
jgi:hypothetical protein